MRDLRCPEHPGSLLRRCRTHGLHGRGIYPQCVPADGGPPHVLSWEEAGSVAAVSATEVQIAADAADTPLTPSELVALCAAANGLTSAETAAQLGKGTQTVKTQRGQILIKLNARNTAQAVCIAIDMGILRVEYAEGAPVGARAFSASR